MVHACRRSYPEGRSLSESERRDSEEGGGAAMAPLVATRRSSAARASETGGALAPPIAARPISTARLSEEFSPKGQASTFIHPIKKVQMNKFENTKTFLAAIVRLQRFAGLLGMEAGGGGW